VRVITPEPAGLSIHRPRRRLRKSPLVSPILMAALADLAATENLPVATLIAVLINEALSVRLRRLS